jgi:hypothetical protein
MQATSLLARQHRQIAHLLTLVEREASSRRDALPELFEELLNHLTLEDHVFYAQAQRAAGVVIKPAREAHAETKRALYALVELPDRGAQFGAALRKLREVFEVHVAQDERLFALFARVNEPSEIEELGEDMAAFAAALGRTSRAQQRNATVSNVTAA